MFRRPEGTTIVYTTIAVISSIFGMLGNSAVIVLAYKHRTSLTPTKLHVAELAVVNLMFSLVQVINVTPLYWTNRWVFGLLNVNLGCIVCRAGIYIFLIFCAIIIIIIRCREGFGSVI